MIDLRRLRAYKLDKVRDEKPGADAEIIIGTVEEKKEDITGSDGMIRDDKPGTDAEISASAAKGKEGDLEGDFKRRVMAFTISEDECRMILAHRSWG